MTLALESTLRLDGTKGDSLALAYASSRDVTIRTGAWADAVGFYESDLGLRITHKGHGIVESETGAFCQHVESGSDHGPVFELLVADVPAAKAPLPAAGYMLIEEDATAPRRYVRDPFGVTYNIGQAAPE